MFERDGKRVVLKTAGRHASGTLNVDTSLTMANLPFLDPSTQLEQI